MNVQTPVANAPGSPLPSEEKTANSKLANTRNNRVSKACWARRPKDGRAKNIEDFGGRFGNGGARSSKTWPILTRKCPDSFSALLRLSCRRYCPSRARRLCGVSGIGIDRRCRLLRSQSLATCAARTTRSHSRRFAAAKGKGRIDFGRAFIRGFIPGFDGVADLEAEAPQPGA